MHSPSKQRRRIEAAQGFLLLGMAGHAQRELAGVPSGERSGQWHGLQAEACRLLEDHDAAVREYERALADDPQNLELLNGLAWCLKRTDRLPAAITAMLQAYGAHPKEASVLYNLACYYALAGDKPQALSWLGRALRMQPALSRLVPDDGDFAGLRSDPDFQFIVQTTAEAERAAGNRV
jgi:Flp pilus assembly protein TadD